MYRRRRSRPGQQQRITNRAGKQPDCCEKDNEEKRDYCIRDRIKEAETDKEGGDTVFYEPMEVQVTVRQGEKEISLPALLVSASSYSQRDDAFAYGTGPRLHNLLPDIARELPRIQWSGDTMIQVPDPLREPVLLVYDGEAKELLRNGLEDAGEKIKELPAGIYYGAVEADTQGVYIEQKGEYETFVWQYVFSLEKK